MNLRNVRTVWSRELRDQLRDRRTLFMVLVLPLLMYPLMGMSLLQLAQFRRSLAPRVLVVGAGQLGEVGGLPPLLEGERFASALTPSGGPPRMTVQRVDLPADADPPEAAAAGDDAQAAAVNQARTGLVQGEFDAVVVFPSGFAERLAILRRELLERAGGDGFTRAPPPEAPAPVLLFDSSRDASRPAFIEVRQLIATWRDQVVGRNLAASNVPDQAVRPFDLSTRDVATPAARRAGVWPKLLPFIVLVWALTGAFYPAVDLCAGEKERGTLETLLVSPAGRAEIVWGKLLTVMVFSMATAVLNLLGAAVTGGVVIAQLAGAGAAAGAAELGMPPVAALAWLIVALPPVAALFSALSLACAAFARSTKEGQYYFMPLFLAVAPLIMLPMSPGVELNLGASLAPVMGLVLLLRALMEGEVWEAARYAAPVAMVTLACCLLATRWAVSQFNQESVLFRSDDKLDLRRWLADLLREKAPAPTPAMALSCVAGVLVLQFALGNAVLPRLAQPGSGFGGLAVQVLMSQAAVLLPAVVLATLLIRRPLSVFRLGRPTAGTLGVTAAAALVAILIHPAALRLQEWVRGLYPLSDEVLAGLGRVQGDIAAAPSPWLAIALLALLPAVCEELTFRGFVLSGLRRGGSAHWAVVISAVAFGVAHPVLQQAVSAGLLGLLIGTLALSTRRLLPCIAFHATHNALPLAIAAWVGAGRAGSGGAVIEKLAQAGLILRAPTGELLGYHPVVAAAGGLLAAAVMWRIIAGAAHR